MPNANDPARMKQALALAQALLLQGGLNGLLRPWNLWNCVANSGRARTSSEIEAQKDALRGTKAGHVPSLLS